MPSARTDGRSGAARTTRARAPPPAPPSSHTHPLSPSHDEHDSMQLNAGGGGEQYLASAAGSPSDPSCSS